MENSKLIKDIKNLTNNIKPRADWVSLNRDLLLHQISLNNKTEPVRISAAGYFGLCLQIFKVRMLEPVVVMFLLFGVFLGSTLTINAAFYSLPGSPLYKVKLALEKTHAAMIFDEQNSVELKIEFAQKRVDEIDKIASNAAITPEEKQVQIQTAVKELKNNVTSLNQHLVRISSQPENADKQKTIQMAISLNSKIQTLAQSVGNAGTDAGQDEVAEMVQEAVENVAKLTDESGQVKGEELKETIVSPDQTQTTTPAIIQ